jgi:DNA-directed RNA polymerase subunit RPC12/RpoP
MEEPCRQCGGMLFHTVDIDGTGHRTLDPRTPLPLETDGGDSFYRCPHCGAKNVIIEKREAGLRHIRIVRVKG